MKVKALTTFVSGIYQGKKGEVVELPKAIATHLIEIGFADAEKAPAKEAAKEAK